MAAFVSATLALPVTFAPSTDYREAETVYSFRGTELKRVYKRWQEHRSPSELYNHGFENMESLGAVLRIAIVSIQLVSTNSWLGTNRVAPVYSRTS